MNTSPDPTPAEAAGTRNADAAKAELELQKLELETAKAKIEALTAESTRLTAERAAADAETPEAKALKDAENRKAIAVANNEAAAARQAQLSALVPDLSKIERGALELKGDGLIGGTALAHRALGLAAQTVAAATSTEMNKLGPGVVWKVLVTGESELATSDAVYVDVITGLEQLVAASTTLTEPPQEGGAETAALGAAAGAAVLAQAIPAVLSLLSAHRTMSTSAVTVTDLAAAAAAAGALKATEGSGVVMHDDFRLLPNGGIVSKRLTAVSEERQKLTSKKVAHEHERSTATAELGRIRAIIGDLEKGIVGATTDEPKKKELQSQLEMQRQSVVRLEKDSSDAAVRIGMIDGLLAAIDEFTAALRVVPEGGRSPLAAAMLREQLHPSPGVGEQMAPVPPYFTHVLLVKAATGSAHQVVDDRPLFWKDRFSVVAVVDVTYILIETATSQVLVAGDASGQASAKGTIGGSFEFA